MMTIAASAAAGELRVLKGPTAAGPGETVTYGDEEGSVTPWLGYPEHRTVAEIDREQRYKAMRRGSGRWAA